MTRPTDEELDLLLREADAVPLPIAGDTGNPGEPYYDSLDMLLDITGDNPPPLSRWAPRDWMRLLGALSTERARADKNATTIEHLASATRSLRAELAEARERGEWLQLSLDSTIDYIEAAKADLRERAERAERDSARLDWLERRNPSRLSKHGNQWMALGDVGSDPNIDGFPVWSHADSLRAAIDAARGEKP